MKRKQTEKESRKPAAKALVIFLFAMLFFTLLSRGIYAYQMPRIAIGQAAPKSISHTISVEGAIIADEGSTGQWTFHAALTKEQARQAKAGDSVRLLFEDGGKTEEGCTIFAIDEKENGMYEAAVRILESRNDFSPHEEGVMEIFVTSKKYSCCVPLSAVYSGVDQDFVLLIRETETIFGTELTAVSRDVVVIDQNENIAALKDGAVGTADFMITYADRQVEPGDKVRLLEDEDNLR